jgi:uncharacterized protein (TIGR00297 family)
MDLVPTQGGLTTIVVGLVISSVVAAGARVRGSLSTSGALAALVVGTAVFAGGGGGWFAVLATFFVTSTLLGRVGAAKKAQVKREFEKGDTRDAWQVLANGGAAAAAALLMAWAPSARWAHAFVAALAAANADTWATELGVLSRGEPWSIVRARRVPRGTSGAVSPLGMAAATAGALVVGVAAAVTMRPVATTLAVAVVFGVGGALVDSVLGATVQARYRCAPCGRDIETPLHHCGATCALVGGVGAVGNDVVNAAATIAAAAAAALLVS